MLVSMTGFGAGRWESDELRVAVEMRTVNHRYFEPMIRLPKGYLALEEKIRSQIAKDIQRGRVEISVVIEDFRLRGRTVNLDSHLLKSYHAALTKAREIVPIEGEFTAVALLAVPELLQVQESHIDPDSVWPNVSDAVGQAVRSLIHMRRSEGDRLQQDILSRLTTFSQHITAITDRAPFVVEAYRDRLIQRLAQWREEVTFDESRLLTEVALMADRSNIDEELVRAKSHVEAFRATCLTGGAVGRKLDFLLQEMNREVNTIGSKASDAVIAAHVVEAKAELEKIREQVQNIE